MRMGRMYAFRAPGMMLADAHRAARTSRVRPPARRRRRRGAQPRRIAHQVPEPRLPVPDGDRHRLRRAGVAVPRRGRRRPRGSGSASRRSPTARSASARARATSWCRCCGCSWPSSAPCRTCSREPQLSNPVDALFESMSGLLHDGRERPDRHPGAAAVDAHVAPVHARGSAASGSSCMFLAVLPRLRVGGRQALFKAEMPGPELPLAVDDPRDRATVLTLYVAHHRRRDRSSSPLSAARGSTRG